MNFSDWEPIYLQILADFGFTRQKDDEAALLISRLLADTRAKDQQISIEHLCQVIAGRDVIVCGKAPSLDGELHALYNNKKSVVPSISPLPTLIIAADGATTTLLKHDIVPDIIVSDLDGNLDDIFDANRSGSIVVVHAHGDNMGVVTATVPKLTNIIATTQSTPLFNVHNFGGFSDGDRCVFLACEFDAARITLLGFDLDDVNVSPMKRKKLKWARTLLGELLEKCPAMAEMKSLI
ncbi:MAG: DUF115 domain-containing protein [Methanosarcinales archaeon]|nr:DUF115 domain-containing protein [Methanosarcinales archaeon]